jgi:hypothetical protein
VRGQVNNDNNKQKEEVPNTMPIVPLSIILSLSNHMAIGSSSPVQKLSRFLQRKEKSKAGTLG